ncbi:MAG: hypothetical protein J6N15_08780 [Ruminiclostridium sp.]|nr:hypothetical protein [Ruminiclostridium sp.]
MDNGIVAYKCPACGASLPYSAETADFHCEYCGSHFTKEQLDVPIQGNTYSAFEEQPDIDEKQKIFGDANRLYVCPGCGAAVITETELSASAECYYCHSPVVLSGRLSGEYRPDLIIPFKKSLDDAKSQFAEWIKRKKFFLAKGFGSPETLDKIQGVYIPFWLADCCVEGKISASCTKRVSSVRRGDYIYVTESKYIVDRDGSLVFRRIPADASSRADDALMDSIEPFDYNSLEQFDLSYLSGHNALRYDVPKEQIFSRVSTRATDTAEEIFRGSIKGYDSVTVTGKDIKITNINYKQAMLPMWFLTFKYKEKMFFFAMNGQTGKFGGTLPVNKAKLALFSFGIPIGVMLLFHFLAMLIGV